VKQYPYWWDSLPGRRPNKTRRRALARYVSARFLQLTALSFAAILAAYLMVDVMERLDWFARYRATGEEVIRFYAARIPLLASRVVPMALMVGSALIASLLAAEGGMIGMRACGIPAIRAIDARAIRRRGARSPVAQRGGAAHQRDRRPAQGPRSRRILRGAR
jgi:hypothetical protein